MGLLDALSGIQNDPSGQRAFGSSNGGMSPLTMALLGLLAYKAVKSFSGSQPSAAPAANDTGAPESGPGAAGNLGDLLKSVLGGGAAGTALSGGLSDLLEGDVGDWHFADKHDVRHHVSC
jgi:hypothetical protein